MQEVIYGEAAEELKTARFVITDTNIDELYGKLYKCPAFVLPAGEDSKNLSVLANAFSAMLKCDLKRNDTIVAFGGGVVGDLAGFAASVYMRGIKWVCIPTTLLAMADSCIGGKTAIDFAGIKNLIGSYHLPEKTIIDARFLSTLPPREVINGWGEILKTSLLDPAFFETLVKNEKTTEEFTLECVRTCNRIKGQITDADMHDTGKRRALNMGHTLGHAIEMLTPCSHGESVILGLQIETLMTREIIDFGFFYLIHTMIQKFGIPVPHLNVERVAEICMLDKKNGEGITLEIPVAPGEVKEVEMSKEQFIIQLRSVL